MESPDPADGAKCDVHRARPVDAPRVRIRVDPRIDLVDELLLVTIVIGEPVRLTEPDEVLAAAELPGHLHVGRTIELVVFDIAAVLQRPRPSGLEVGQPRDLRAERGRTRAEQVEL